MLQTGACADPSALTGQKLSTTIVAGADALPDSSTAITVCVFWENGVPYRTVRPKPTVLSG